MRRLLPVLRIVPLLSILIGCGEPAGPDPKTEATRMESAQGMRRLYDGAGGDYARLDAAQRAEFARYTGGDEAKAQAAWNVMKGGSAAAPRGTGAPR